ncbi:hypothetical protein TVAG_101070 [Trichomonas vaginalis G3]|uniref:Uncharacterized protein n=1 Tax=Trichomonas vaginalis (strain ATCC PRA-98 / G3) TaxID=412133 RepID=A2DJI9_TRIV3|nr:hypothetical protein TVAGG3_1036180 [Trichomonas vaginalis G3]EAY19389.1 hypothetical protein TVAG_101070 [Trichomonas vaginalis G3]KAI5493217.1 hypothetical protein TVAGG3_1036180 [Trichomonas vaginalis G3]|eukprot:XP_001580375.1 hypothetical protein [Trichomonas vaginalis G3]
MAEEQENLSANIDSVNDSDHNEEEQLTDEQNDENQEQNNEKEISTEEEKQNDELAENQTVPEGPPELVSTEVQTDSIVIDCSTITLAPVPPRPFLIDALIAIHVFLILAFVLKLNGLSVNAAINSLFSPGGA